MTTRIIHQAIESLTLDLPFPERIGCAYHALGVAELSIQELAFLDPPDPPPRWGAVHRSAAFARSALARAPSIRWPLTTPPPTPLLAAHDVGTVTGALIELADVLVPELVDMAGRAPGPDDAACCLRSALLTNDLHEALRRSQVPDRLQATFSNSHDTHQ